MPEPPKTYAVTHHQHWHSRRPGSLSDVWPGSLQPAVTTTMVWHDEPGYEIYLGTYIDVEEKEVVYLSRFAVDADGSIIHEKELSAGYA